MFTLLKKFRKWVHKPFTPPTLDEIRAQQLLESHRELQQSQHVIRTHQFQEHMTKAKIQALIGWEEVEKQLGEKNAS